MSLNATPLKVRFFASSLNKCIGDKPVGNLALEPIAVDGDGDTVPLAALGFDLRHDVKLKPPRKRLALADTERVGPLQLHDDMHVVIMTMRMICSTISLTSPGLIDIVAITYTNGQVGVGPCRGGCGGTGVDQQTQHEHPCMRYVL